MMIATSESPNYRTRFSDGTHDGVADTTADKGGDASGFRPHNLLEAALATCVNMTVRMYADNHNIPLSRVVTKVELDRSKPDEAMFQYELEFEGDLTREHVDKLIKAASACPVRRTLSKKIRFKNGDSG